MKHYIHHVKSQSWAFPFKSWAHFEMCFWLFHSVLQHMNPGPQMRGPSVQLPEIPKLLGFWKCVYRDVTHIQTNK